MKRSLLLSMMSFVVVLASAQLTYDFNQQTGVLTIDGDGTSITAKDVNKAVNRNNSYDNNNTLKEVVIAASNIKRIEDEAFSRFDALESITLPETLEFIGNSTFINCSALSSITLPESLNTIGIDAFRICNALTNISVSTKNNHFASVDGVLFNKQKTTLLIYPVGKQATSYAVPENTKIIDNYAFMDCTLTHITLPETLESIGNHAFYDCSYLISITLPNAIKTIGNNAFSSCSSLKTITLPNALTTIENGVFSRCSSLTNIVLPDALTTIKEDAFEACDSLTNIILPDGLVTIGDAAFEGCSSLKTITLPAALKKISDGTFCACFSLTNITVSTQNNYFSSVDGVLFNKQKTTLITYPTGKNQTSYTVPESTDSIGDNAFYYSSLRNIILPESLEEIGNKAFYHCESLENIIFPKSIKMIGDEAFYECKYLTNIVLPTSLKTIGNSVFRDCHRLKSVILPKSLEVIGNFAFADCIDLESIILPESLRTIGELAFSDCLSLTDITCLSNTEPEFGSNVFAWASKTRTVYVPNATSGFSNTNWGNANTAVTIKYGEYPTSIKENISTSGLNTHIANGTLTIKDLKQGTVYTVTTINGSLIAKGIATQYNCQVNLTGHGIGIVNAAGISKKFIY